MTTVGNHALASTSQAEAVLGVLHVFVAFDWGDEVDLERARQLVQAEFHALPRRRRTPASIGYRPPPLRFGLPPLAIEMPAVGRTQAFAEATLFDFGAVSAAIHQPFELSIAGLSALAAWLADMGPLVQAVRAVLEPYYQRLRPAVERPQWSPTLSEEYAVFQLFPNALLTAAEPLPGPRAAWLAGLVRLEIGTLSPEEVAEALRLQLRYSPHDLFVPDWAAAVLLDRDCEETLLTIEFANLQLLEFRHIDDRLDDSLAAAYRLIYPLARRALPFWRSTARSLRLLGSLRVEATGLFERTTNVLKLVGDQYLARVYDLLVARFHLNEWQENIQRKLDAGEGVYRVLAEQSTAYRTEFLEAVVILLIVLEIILAILRH